MRQLGQHVCTAVELFMNEAARSACMYGCRALHE